LGTKRIHTVRVRGGNLKYRALRLEAGNFSWGSEAVTRKTRILNCVYNPSNNEYVRTNTLVKNSVIQIDSTPFRQWYDQQYGISLGKKKKSEKKEGEIETEVKKGKNALAKQKKRAEKQVLSPLLEDQFGAGRLYAVLSSRPGQSGRADGYILEGPELEFYLKKLAKKKEKKEKA